MTLKLILGGLLDVIFPSFEVQKPGTGDRDVQSEGHPVGLRAI